MAKELTERQQQILDFIDSTVRNRGYPPSVREIGEAVGLTSPSTVHSHMSTLQDRGYIERDPSIPRGIKVRRDPTTGLTGERGEVRHVPLLGDIAAGFSGVLPDASGSTESAEEFLPLPASFTGEGELFMVRVKGDSMIDAGIFDGDYVVARAQTHAKNGDLIIALVEETSGWEATVKYFRQEDSQIALIPANPAFSEMYFEPLEVMVRGAVVTVLRKI
tara:strand:- start:317 stop:973 length:657 start_codon:yes stop_codon:yes gene_type:complete